MKKIAALILVSIFLISLAACGGDEKVNETTLQNAETTSEVVENTTNAASTEEITSAESLSEETTAEVTTVENASSEAEESSSAENDVQTLPIDSDGIEMSFLSGAGGWSSELKLFPDGTFSGSYHDSELGSVGDEYPNGTVYVCAFRGKFSGIKKINDYSYSMDLDEIFLEKNVDEEWIEDGVRYVASGPYGIADGNEFVFYLPEAPVSEMNEDFLSWWPFRYDHSETPFETLSCYGLRNLATNDGFFS